MLQWMGGSRRKVTTSRKSTHKRQKQYFEQRKRQEQRDRLDNYADGRNTIGQLYEKSRSLDILSLMNLATISQECKYVRTCEEDPEINDSSVDQIPEHQPTSLKSTVTLKNYGLKETRTTSSSYQVKNATPERVNCGGPDNVRSFCDHSFDGTGDKVDNQKMTTEHQLSVLDILGDDEPNDNLERTPIHEAHVAFSIEGLGKVGLETPVHSPDQPYRGCFSPPKPVRRHHSSKNLNYIVDNLEYEVNVPDINIPLGGSSLELPSNSRIRTDCFDSFEATKFPVKRSTLLHPLGNYIDSFLGKDKHFFHDMEEKLEKTWSARLSFLDGNFLDGKEYNKYWKDQEFQIDDFRADIFRAQYHEISEFDSYMSKKSSKAAEKFNTLTSESPASSFIHQVSAADHDFITLDGPRYPTIDESWDFEALTKQPAWTYFETEDGRDSTSLLSEESCSSTAARDDKTNNSASNSLKLNQSMRRYRTDLLMSPKTSTMKNIREQETQNKEHNRVYQGKNLHQSGKLRTVPNPTISKSVHSNSDDRKCLGLQHGSLSGKGYNSIDVHSGVNSFCRTSFETEPAPWEYELWSKGPFCTLPVSKLNLSTQSSPKKSKLDVPAFQKPYNFPFHKNLVSKSRNLDTNSAFQMEGKSPNSSHVNGPLEDLEFAEASMQESVSKTDEYKLDFQNFDSKGLPKEPQKEVSNGKVDLSSENGKPMDASNSKDNCSECKEPNKASTELTKKPNMGDFPEHAEESSSDRWEISDKLESCVDEKEHHLDANIPLPFQNKRKGREDTEANNLKTGIKGLNGCADASYHIMLESYVLQLLHVQKVLKEASEQENADKV